MDRKNNVRVLFSDDEKRMLQHLAGARGLKVADTVRTLVREAFRAEVAPRSPDEALRQLGGDRAGRGPDDAD